MELPDDTPYNQFEVRSVLRQQALPNGWVITAKWEDGVVTVTFVNDRSPISEELGEEFINQYLAMAGALMGMLP